ncbi:MAG: NAD(P)-dependent oxidoreductase [Victivallales bacterium]|nr:NAD(P)-dependent oxidoreductase [Victivallales bacterium]
MSLPQKIVNEAELEQLLSDPPASLVEMASRLKGDVMILGVAGKMGVSMAMQAVKAIQQAGVKKRVFGVARFSRGELREKLEQAGVETITCDLMDRQAIAKLPLVPNVIFMAGRKFGTEGSEALTWAMNTLAPAYVAEHFRDSRIVAFSTGCVYPLVGVESCGCTEEIPPAPVGDYSQSCLGRERIFQHYSITNGTKTLLFRLNYSVDLRYGVLYDIASAVWEGRPVDNTVGYYNVIWQGDATAAALQCLEWCESPSAVLNVTGPEVASVEQTAYRFGKLLGRDVTFRQERAGNLCYLNNASRMCERLGYPRVPLNRLIEWQAEWIRNGGRAINAPTHFEVNTGRF